MSSRAVPRRRWIATAVVLLATLAVISGCMAVGDRTGVVSATAAAAGSDLAGNGRLVAATSSTTTAPTTTAPTTTTTTAEVAPTAVGTCATVTYTPASASTAQVGDLCRPSDGVVTHETVIVLVHGGGGSAGSRDDLDAWQDYWTAEGYVTFSIDYTLVDPDTDDGVYPLPEQNVKAAVQYVWIWSAALDVDRVVLQGHSAGARLGGIVATTPDDPSFAGDEQWTGVSDRVDGFIGFYGYYDGMQFDGDAYYGGDGEVPDGADADAQADGTSGWTVLIHSTQDQIVDVAASQDFAAALATAGEDVEYLETNDVVGHGFDGYDQPQLTAAGRLLAQRLQTVIEAGTTEC